MDFIVNLFIETLGKVWITFTHNWLFLFASVLISVGLKLFVKPEKISTLLTRYQRVGVLVSTAAAVATPFCSCGTTAVILGMIASTIPWAPIVAFMVASPLTSPEELVYSAGIFGWKFAIVFFVSSILLGLLGGALAEFFEKRNWLKNQARFTMYPVEAAATQGKPVTVPLSPRVQGYADEARKQVKFIPAAKPPVRVSNSCCTSPEKPTSPTCGCSSASSAMPQKNKPCACGSNDQIQVSQVEKHQKTGILWINLKNGVIEFSKTGGKLLLMFLGFSFLGYILNGLIPAAWITAIFGKGNFYSVPLAATLGLPLYVNTEGSLPLVRALIDNGMSQGAALAFLISGAGTSIGAIGGALTIARWRVIALVVGTLWAGGIILGYAYDLLLTMRLI